MHEEGMRPDRIIYGLAILLAVLGYITSFFLARFVESSAQKFEVGIYEEESKFLKSRIFECVESITNNPTLVDVASIYDIENPEDFDSLSSSLFRTSGISRISYIDLVSQNELSKIEAFLTEMYNQTINAWYISDYAPEGDYSIVEYTSPELLSLIGLVVNSDEDRDVSIKEVIQSKNTVFVDNIELQDGSGLGRLTFHPVLVEGSVDKIVVIILSYVKFFEPFSSQFVSIFPEMTIKILVSEIEIYTSGSSERDFSFCSTEGPITICVSDILSGSESDVYFYMLFAGIILSTLMSCIVCLLNHFIVKAKTDSKFKTRFIADMSHEIRTPMNGIMGMSELLGEMSLDATAKYYVRTIRSCGDTLLSIINDILDMSKIEAGNMDIVNEQISIKNIIEETFQNLWITYRTHHGVSRNKLEGSIEIMEGIPSVLMGDPVRIRQVYTNLITNSMKFTESGHIKTIVSFDNFTDKYGMLQITVKDTGSGMTQEGLAKAFKPFKQVHSRSDVGGTGLGLSICIHLCSLMGGGVTGESEVGEGTTMRASIRADHSIGNKSITLRELKTFENGSIDTTGIQWDAESAKSIMLEFFHKLEPQTKSTHPEVLVVDDVLINRKLLTRMMSTIGITVTTCDNGIEAVQICETKEYSLVLMDMVMPVMNGVDACKQIRSGGLNKQTPLVFVSANVQSTAIDECTNAGGNGFITKPVTKNKLVETIIKHSSPGEKEFVRRYVCDNV